MTNTRALYLFQAQIERLWIPSAEKSVTSACSPVPALIIVFIMPNTACPSKQDSVIAYVRLRWQGLPFDPICSAPEIQTTSQGSLLSDLFSLGMVICAVFNGGRSLIEANHSNTTYMKQFEVVSSRTGEGEGWHVSLLVKVCWFDSANRAMIQLNMLLP